MGFAVNAYAGRLLVRLCQPAGLSIHKETVLQTAGAALLPVLPLALTMISLEDLVKRLAGILL
jgi:hypothetical protein